MNTLDIISRALRRIGVLAGGQLPRDVEAADALQVLIGLYRRLITEGSFGELSDAIPVGDYTAAENQRVLRTSTHVGSITLPDNIVEDQTSRPPRDCSVVIISDELSGATAEFIYDGAVKKWVPLTTLSLTSVAPLANRDPLGLTCLLAMELADEYGQPISDLIKLNGIRFLSGITHNWSNPQTQTKGVYF